MVVSDSPVIHECQAFYELSREPTGSMNIQIENYKKLNHFLKGIFPYLDLSKPELSKTRTDELVHAIVTVIDVLAKCENLYENRNIILPRHQGFFSENTVDLMENISIYLYKFNPRFFSFTKTEAQTFVFILENLIDYFKKHEVFREKKERENLFVDHRFWIENFLQIVEQKINGEIIIRPPGDIHGRVFYLNPAGEMNLAPFVVLKGIDIVFFSSVSEKGLRYKNLATKKTSTISNSDLERNFFQFLIRNFCFKEINEIKQRIHDDGSQLIKSIDLIENTFVLYQEKMYAESLNILNNLDLDLLKIPLLYLLKAKNLMNSDHLLDTKRLIQKFVVKYPSYVDAFEMLGDIYQKEEEFEQALSCYDRVLHQIQNKRVAEKSRKVKSIIEKSKGRGDKLSGDDSYNITEDVFKSNDIHVHRDKDLNQMIEILISKFKRNLMLIGESGVGKTTLIRMLAKHILDGEVPDALKGKIIREINFVSIITGSKYRGQFEEKILKFLTEFKNKKAILVLENIHLMMASGTSRGTSLDLINILKQFLRDNSIQVIATTTYEEFKNNIEKDNAFLSFFQRINVGEMPAEKSKEIIKNLSNKNFSDDNIMITDEIIQMIVENAKRSVKEKKLPDSAIMIYERSVAKVMFKIFMGDERSLQITQSDVAEVLSDILNLPESNISISMKERLENLKDGILADIVGQDESVTRLVSTITTSKLGFDIKRNRPDGVFLFIGPTGVGKTETALALARSLYGSEDYLIRIDMSEYMEKFTYSRFVGAAPGYVGYYDANQLSDKVRQNPFSIILLDEIEKADSQLLNIFLQVFDAGRLTDARGNVVDFSHATVIMTSNIGTSLFSQKQMGYHGDLDGGEVSRSSLLNLLKKYFSLEFLNRIDEILVFNQLNSDDVRKIVDIQLKETRSHLEKEDKELIIHKETIDYIIGEGYSKEYGARNITRVLRKFILEKIARLSLEKHWKDFRYVICSMGKEGGEIRLELANQVPLEDSGFFGHFDGEIDSP